MPKPLVYKPKPGLRYTENGTSLYLGDCLDILKTLESESIDSVVTDPPAGISFMGKKWDHNRGGRDSWIDWLSGIMAECLRVLKPGGHALVWSIPRTSHWTGTAIEEAGFEVRDCVYHIFGCLSEDTEILVDGQWEPYQKAVAGRLALCYDIGNGTYSWQPIQQLYVYDYKDTAYHITSDSTDQIVSCNHRCLVERGGEQVFREAKALKCQENVPVLENVLSLLEALPLPDERASSSQEDLFVGVHGEKVCSRENRQAFGAPREVACAEVSRVRQAYRDSREAGGVQQEELLQQALSGHSSHTTLGPFLCEYERAQAFRPSFRSEESCMERRDNLLPKARQLQADQVRSLSNRVSCDGPQGWVRDGASAVCCEGDGATPSPIGSGASRQPRSAGQSPGESATVCQQPGAQTVRGEWFTSATLATITPVHYSGKVWCVKVPTGAFVARRNGKVFVTGNSGFPKSLDVSKAITKNAPQSTTREIKEWLEAQFAKCGKSKAAINSECGFTASDYLKTEPGNDAGGRATWHLLLPKPEKWRVMKSVVGFDSTYDDYIATLHAVSSVSSAALKTNPEIYGTYSGQEKDYHLTAEAQQWQGWGTALKPAVELWWLARKPLEKGCTVAANVQQYGTGALNVDACRISAPEGLTKGGCRRTTNQYHGSNTISGGMTEHPKGRFPANLIHDGSEEVVALFPETGASKSGGETSRTGIGLEFGMGTAPRTGHDDSGSAARFFYCPKAGKKDRGEGNSHPTVKPTALMRYLVRLVTPPGGLVLDPFFGSGTTAVACIREGFRCLGIEQDYATLEMAIRRVKGEVNA